MRRRDEEVKVERDSDLKGVTTGVLRDDTGLFKQCMECESFRRRMTDTVFGLTYSNRHAG